MEDNGSAGPQKEQSDGVDSARSKRNTLAHHEYNILAPKATEGSQSNAGAANREDGYGTLANREGKGTEKEGDETPRRALPVQESDGGDTNRRDTEARVPPKRLRALNTCGHQGGEGGGEPLTQ